MIWGTPYTERPVLREGDRRTFIKRPLFPRLLDDGRWAWLEKLRYTQAFHEGRGYYTGWEPEYWETVKVELA